MRNSRAFIAAVSLFLVASCAHQRAAETPKTLRIFVARHGQTDWNLQKRLQGQTNTELNETGRGQAMELGKKISGMGIQHVYTSALKRSMETGALAAPGVAVDHLAGLNEQAIGRFEGLWVDGRDPAGEAEWTKRRQDPQDSFDGGESREQFATRVCTTTRTLTASYPDGGTILVVGHGGTNTMILRCLLDLTPEAAATISQANDELYLVEIAAGSPRLWKAIPKDKLGEL